MVSREAALHALEQVIDPALGIDVVNLGLVYCVEIVPESGQVLVEMTLTSAGCPIGPLLTTGVRQALEPLPGVKSVVVQVVWQPPLRGRARLGLR